MDIDSVITWLRDTNPIWGSIAAILAIAGVVFGVFKYSKNRPNNLYDNETVAKIAAKLAAEFRIQDAETIKQLEETIKALGEQDADKYDIKDALALLSQGKTEEAEKIFELIAIEAKQKGQDSKLKEATALRHIGSLAFLHDTQKSLKAYKESTDLDPDNKDDWNLLGHLYKRIGEIEKAENAYMTVKKLAGNDQEYQAIACGNLGLVHRIRGQSIW